jgi:hypothetical protein
MENEILLTLLARTDATFWPTRNFAVPGTGLFYERRRDYLTHGLPWSSKGGTDEQARKSSQRELDGLAKNGLVQTFGPRGRTRGERLTAAADDNLRRRIGIATYADSLALLDELYRRRDDDDGFDGLGDGLPAGKRDREPGLPWTSEVSLADIQWGDDAQRGYYVLLFEDFAPLLWRSLVRSGSDSHGRVWYSPTATGYALAEQRHATGLAIQKYPPEPLDGGDADGYDFYRAARMLEIDGIRNGTPAQRSEIGDLPLTCSPALRKYTREAVAPAVVAQAAQD